MFFKTRQQIASEMGISTKTLSRWLKQKNIKLDNRLVSPKDVELIMDAFRCVSPPASLNRGNNRFYWYSNNVSDPVGAEEKAIH